MKKEGRKEGRKEKKCRKQKLGYYQLSHPKIRF
jgi:hypothetical protein